MHIAVSQNTLWVCWGSFAEMHTLLVQPILKEMHLWAFVLFSQAGAWTRSTAFVRLSRRPSTRPFRRLWISWRKILTLFVQPSAVDYSRTGRTSRRANKPHYALPTTANINIRFPLGAHTGLMWHTTEASVFTPSCVGFWDFSFLPFSSLVLLWTLFPKSSWTSCWVKVQLEPSPFSQ